jgi:hypothetical protein
VKIRKGREIVKAKTKILMLLAMVALFACLVSAATAQTDTNTYAVTKTSPANPVVGSTVVVTATTSNSKVNTVVFNWYAPGDYPSGPIAYTSTATSSSGFTSSYVVTMLGQWTVTATFERWETVFGGQFQKLIWNNPAEMTVTVSGNFFVLPEYPLIGTAGIGVAMLLALLVFRRKQISNQLKTD